VRTSPSNVTAPLARARRSDDRKCGNGSGQILVASMLRATRSIPGSRTIFEIVPGSCRARRRGITKWVTMAKSEPPLHSEPPAGHTQTFPCSTTIIERRVCRECGRVSSPCQLHQPVASARPHRRRREPSSDSHPKRSTDRLRPSCRLRIRANSVVRTEDSTRTGIGIGCDSVGKTSKSVQAGSKWDHPNWRRPTAEPPIRPFKATVVRWRPVDVGPAVWDSR